MSLGSPALSAITKSSPKWSRLRPSILSANLCKVTPRHVHRHAQGSRAASASCPAAGNEAARERTSNSSTNRIILYSGTGAATNVIGTVVDLSGKHVMRGRITATTAFVSADGNTEQSVSAVPSTNVNRTRIGAGVSSTVSGYWQGVINAILVTNPLSATQASDLMAYLKARGGIA